MGRLLVKNSFRHGREVNHHIYRKWQTIASLLSFVVLCVNSVLHAIRRRREKANVKWREKLITRPFSSFLPFAVRRKRIYSTVSFFPFFSFLPKVLLAFMAIPWESLATTGFYFLNQPWREHILYSCAVNVKYRFYFCRISQVNMTTSLMVLEFKQYLGFRGRTSLLALLASSVTCNVNFSE